MESHKKVCENKNFCNLITPSEGTEILDLNQSRIFHQVFQRVQYRHIEP